MFCSYTIELGITAAAGPVGSDVIIQLQSDVGTPVTARCSVRLNLIGTSGDFIRTRQVLSYIVPAGASVLLATVQNVGGGTPTIVNQVEEIFTPPP